MQVPATPHVWSCTLLHLPTAANAPGLTFSLYCLLRSKPTRQLLGSGVYQTQERVAKFQEHVQTILGDITEILFVLWVLEDHGLT